MRFRLRVSETRNQTKGLKTTTAQIVRPIALLIPLHLRHNSNDYKHYTQNKQRNQPPRPPGTNQAIDGNKDDDEKPSFPRQLRQHLP